MLSRDLWLVWLLRPDVRGPSVEFDPARGRDFLCWWMIHGRTEYPGAEAVSREGAAPAFESVDVDLGGRRAALPAILEWLWREREDLQAKFPGTDPDDAARLVVWFYLHGVREARLFGFLPAQQLAMLHNPTGPAGPETRLPVTQLMLWARQSRPDIEQEFPLGTAAGRDRLVTWFYAHGAAELGLTPYLGPMERAAVAALAARRADPVEARLMREMLAGSAEKEPPPRRYGPPTRRDGVNLIGYARGELGTGEDIRMAAQALGEAGVPYSVVEIPVGPNTRDADDTLAIHISDAAPFAINIVCLPGFDATRVRLESDPSLWQGRRTIGWWPWELPQWPPVWRPAFGLVDELWAPTCFVQEAYAAAAPVPVTLMPPAVSIDRARRRSRARLGLPYGVFLFVYVFDGNSYLARKNPEAAIAAFRRAFPGEERVGLVIKAMNALPDERWQTLAAACAADARIRLITGTWERADLLGLIGACDALVSLHRAEGFGRVVAEAMLLEKPVIATDFSGSADFVTAETGFPVRCAMRPVEAGEYPYGEGQFWADPDIPHAAALMREVAANPDRSRGITLAGKAAVAARYAPAVVGDGIVARLRALGLGSREEAGDTVDPGARPDMGAWPGRELERRADDDLPAPAPPAVSTRLLRLDPGLYALRIDGAVSGSNGFGPGAIRISSPPSRESAPVEIIATGEGGRRWVGHDGGMTLLRVARGGGWILLTICGMTEQAAASLEIGVERLDRPLPAPRPGNA